MQTSNLILPPSLMLLSTNRPQDFLVTEFMSIHALETLMCMLEGGKSSVLDVIELDGAIDIWTGSQHLKNSRSRDHTVAPLAAKSMWLRGLCTT